MSSALAPYQTGPQGGTDSVRAIVRRALEELYAVWRVSYAPNAGPLVLLSPEDLLSLADAPMPGRYLLAAATDPDRRMVSLWRGTLSRVDVPWDWFTPGVQGTVPDVFDVEPVDDGAALRLGGTSVSAAELFETWGVPGEPGSEG